MVPGESLGEQKGGGQRQKGDSESHQKDAVKSLGQRFPEPDQQGGGQPRPHRRLQKDLRILDERFQPEVGGPTDETRDLSPKDLHHHGPEESDPNGAPNGP